MPRTLLSLLLVIAVALFGGFAHAEPEGQSRVLSAPCPAAHPATDGQGGAFEPCGTVGHTTPGACAIACLGSIAAIWFSAPDAMPADLRSMTHPAATARVLHGRSAETADRPPKPI